MAGSEPNDAAAGATAPQRWTDTWRDLVAQVVDRGRCTGCSGCILACPRDVLDLDHATWRPHLAPEAWLEGAASDCIHSARGCTMCTRACPRFGDWEADGDIAAHGRPREPEEVLGVHRRILLVKATDERVAGAGQDGGLATAMLAYAIDRDLIDAALVSFTGPGQAVHPGVARTRDDLVRAAGSRYTYSPNTLALDEAVALDGVERLGLVSVGCQASVPSVTASRGARKVARRFALTIGLLCSKTFDDAIFDDLVRDGYGVAREDVVKVNIKGRLQIWTGPTDRDPDLEIPLKECQPYQRAGCNHCPDFAAQHADISLGGIGRFRKTTLTITRTALAEELVTGMEREGLISVSDALEHDPKAVDLISRMAARQRERWAAVPGGGDG